MFGELAKALHYLASEVGTLRQQLRADADERRCAREDQAIYGQLLFRSARIVRRLTRLDSSVNPTTQPN